jgi:hypothetical protein
MACLARDCGGVPSVAEKDKIRQAHAAGGGERSGVRGLLDQLPDGGTVRQHHAVAGQTLGHRRKSGALRLPRIAVTCDAAQLQSCVTLVREGNFPCDGCDRYGSEKATK